LAGKEKQIKNIYPEVSEQILNGTSAQFRLFSASNGKWDKKLKPEGFTS